jgi:diadenosine tetraphosphate (Ap4A) HIT family hydrolase
MRAAASICEIVRGVSACVICEKHRGEGPLVGEPLYADDLVVASHAPILGSDAYLGYAYVEPRRHVRGLAELTDDEAARLATTITMLARAMEAATGADTIYSWVCDHTPHHHVHVVPKYPETPQEFWAARVVEWPDAPRGGHDEVKAVSQRIRDYLRPAG